MKPTKCWIAGFCGISNGSSACSRLSVRRCCFGDIFGGNSNARANHAEKSRSNLGRSGDQYADHDYPCILCVQRTTRAAIGSYVAQGVPLMGSRSSFAIRSKGEAPGRPIRWRAGFGRRDDRQPTQAQRERTLSAFRAGRLRSLVATDVAARGWMSSTSPKSSIMSYRPIRILTSIERTNRSSREGRGDILILSQSEEREYLRMVRRLQIETKKLALPVFLALPSPAPMPVNEPQAPRHRPRRSAEPSGRRFREGENRGSGSSSWSLGRWV